jgi:hypothetical protein
MHKEELNMLNSIFKHNGKPFHLEILKSKYPTNGKVNYLQENIMR